MASREELRDQLEELVESRAVEPKVIFLTKEEERDFFGFQAQRSESEIRARHRRQAAAHNAAVKRGLYRVRF